MDTHTLEQLVVVLLPGKRFDSRFYQFVRTRPVFVSRKTLFFQLAGSALIPNTSHPNKIAVPNCPRQFNEPIAILNRASSYDS